MLDAAATEMKEEVSEHEKSLAVIRTTIDTLAAGSGSAQITQVAVKIEKTARDNAWNVSITKKSLMSLAYRT